MSLPRRPCVPAMHMYNRSVQLFPGGRRASLCILVAGPADLNVCVHLHPWQGHMKLPQTPRSAPEIEPQNGTAAGTDSESHWQINLNKLIHIGDVSLQVELFQITADPAAVPAASAAAVELAPFDSANFLAASPA